MRAPIGVGGVGRSSPTRTLPMFTIRSTFALLLALGVMAACGEESRPEESDDDVLFRVQDHLLAGEVAVPGSSLRFRPPAGWDSMALDRAEQVLDTLVAGNRGSLPITLHHLYRLEEGGSAVVVSSVAFPDSVSHDSTFALIERRIRTQWEGADIRVDRFDHAGLPFRQFMTVRPELVTFKLFVHGDRENYVQFDYILPRATFEALIAQVESSIGSIRPE